MIKETIIILYYLLIMNLLSCLKITNNILYNYIWILILININTLIFNISYNRNINNIIIFFDMILSILIIKELNIINTIQIKNENKNKEQNKYNIYIIKFLYYICLINIGIFMYNIFIYNEKYTINTI